MKIASFLEVKGLKCISWRADGFSWAREQCRDKLFLMVLSPRVVGDEEFSTGWEFFLKLQFDL